MKLLPAVPECLKDYLEIESIIKKIWKDYLYLPLIQDLKGGKKLLQNSQESLQEALLDGRVSFRLGRFQGRFNSRVSKDLRNIGAVWERRTRTFFLPLQSVPLEVRQAISLSESNFAHKMGVLQRKIDLINPTEISDRFKATELIERMSSKVNDSIQRHVFIPKLSRDQKQRIAEEYTTNMQLYIKDWTETEIIKLRKDMNSLVFRGGRYESVIEEIQDRYEVSKGKAKFLARQETHLLTAKLEQVQYQSAGLHDYVWECVNGSPNHPVRPMHLALNGTKQKFSNPPVVNEKGECKNPGCDYGCRCKARVVLQF